MNMERNYNDELNDSANSESEKYAYGFDFDVIHPYMVKSFEPFFNKGSLLELGSFKGDFTRRLLPYFDDVTCVEASDVAISEAKKNLSGQVKFVNSLFERATLPKRYDNILLTHVLEHLDGTDAERAASEASRVTVPGGRIFVRSFSEGDLRSGGKDTDVRGNGIAYRYRTADEIASLFPNLRVIRSETSGEETRFGGTRVRAECLLIRDKL